MHYYCKSKQKNHTYKVPKGIINQRSIVGGMKNAQVVETPHVCHPLCINTQFSFKSTSSILCWNNLHTLIPKARKQNYKHDPLNVWRSHTIRPFLHCSKALRSSMVWPHWNHKRWAIVGCRKPKQICNEHYKEVGWG
jgi:hypothetical protein